jgi:aspartate/methionine/tyrosine aminotransferase
LADNGIAIAPGIDCDPERGNSFVRLSFAGPISDIEEALRRIGTWLPGQKGGGS